MKPKTSFWLAVGALILCVVILSLTSAWNVSEIQKPKAVPANKAAAANSSSDSLFDSADTKAVSNSSSPQKGSGGSFSNTSTVVPSAPATPQLVSTVAGHKVEYPGQFVQAVIQANGKSYELTPNQMGNFERVYVAPKDKVQVQVSYPQGQAGDAVAVEVEDGGNLNKDQMSEVAKLDEQKTIQFQFQTTGQEGIYRIALRNGPDVKIVNVWAGQEPQVRQ
jgi:cytoskeletal protein RodZ